MRYAYYDRSSGDAAVARAAPRALAVGQGAEPQAARPLPPLDRSAREAWTAALAAGLLPWGWLVLLLGPPLGAWLWRRRVASQPAMDEDAEPDAAPRSGLGRLEHAFEAVLVSHVPDPVARDGDGLARALRAAGVESAVADHVMRLRDRLRAARYGPRGLGDAAELAAELAQVLKVLDAEPAGGRHRRWLVAVCLGALVGAASLPGLAVAQAPSAEALYDIGALRAATDSFAARAAARPGVAAAGWLGLWLAVAARRRGIALLLLALATAACGGLALREWRHRAWPVAVIASAGTPVRVAPYGAASAAITLDAGAAVYVERHA